MLLCSFAAPAEQQVPVLEKIAIAGIGSVLSNVLDAPCSISRVQLDLNKQVLELSGVKIGNPKGFDTASAIQVEHARVEADPKLLFGKAPEIRVLSIDGVTVNAEANRHGINLKKLLDSANRRVPAPLLQGDPNKRFKINSAVLDNGIINITTDFLGKNTTEKKLNKIEMSLVGKDGQGVTAQEAMSTLMNKLLEETDLLNGGLDQVLSPLGGLLGR
jgi:hypothetical protein